MCSIAKYALVSLVFMCVMPQVTAENEGHSYVRTHSSEDELNSHHCADGEFWSTTDFRCMLCGFCCEPSIPIKECLRDGTSSDMACKEDDNCKESFWHKHKEKFIISGAVLGCVCLIVIIILVARWRIRKAKGYGRFSEPEEEIGEPSNCAPGVPEEVTCSSGCSEVPVDNVNEYRRDTVHSCIEERLE